MKLKQSHDKENDILSVMWYDYDELSVEYSEEITSRRGNEFVIDYDKNGRIIGIEIFDFEKGTDK